MKSVRILALFVLLAGFASYAAAQCHRCDVDFDHPNVGVCVEGGSGNEPIECYDGAEICHIPSMLVACGPSFAAARADQLYWASGDVYLPFSDPRGLAHRASAIYEKMAVGKRQAVQLSLVSTPAPVVVQTCLATLLQRQSV